MNKIYFAPAWGLSNKEMTDWYKKQTPRSEGVWGAIDRDWETHQFLLYIKN